MAAFWPNLRASEPRSAIPTADGYLIGFVVNDGELKALATACQKLLEHAARRYRARSRL
jgi:hypothetical protein